MATLPTEPLIYDRTKNDVDRVIELTEKIRNKTITSAELQEWNGNLKGAINTSDLNRIISYINYLSEELQIPVTSQTVPAIPRTNWYSILKSNLNNLRSNYTIHADTPKVPNSPLNTYQKWNDIEKLLFDLLEIFNSQDIYYAGDELYSNNILI